MFPHRLRSKTPSFVLACVLLLAPGGSSEAISIRDARIAKGSVQVRGSGAKALAALTWEGQSVGSATKRGKFTFATSLLPSDCVGDLSDGSTARAVIVEGCGPTCCSTKAGMVVSDANGTVVGALLQTFFDYGQVSTNVPLASVVRSLAGQQIAISVSESGFYETLSELYFGGRDCAGEPLVRGGGGGLVKEALTVGSVAYVPIGGPTEDPTQSVLSLRSTEGSCIDIGGTFVEPDRCCLNAIEDGSLLHTPVLAFDLTSLGLVAPFRIDGGF